MIVKRIVNRITGNYWRAVQCKWPYDPGWATYNSRTNTVLDTGLPKWHAKELCRRMNRGEAI